MRQLPLWARCKAMVSETSLLCHKSCCCMLRLGCRSLCSPRVAAQDTRPYTYTDCSSRAMRYAVTYQPAAKDKTSSPLLPSSALPHIIGNKEAMAKRKVAVFVAYVGSSFRGEIMTEGLAPSNAMMLFDSITDATPPQGLRIPAHIAARLTTLLFKAFRYSAISLVALSRMFYSRLYTMRVLSYLQITGTCTKLAGHVAAGQIKECMRLPT